jgi:DNA-packaging protein gp3
MAHAGGRPLKLESPEKFIELANNYFNATPINQWTITGLALSLQTSRETLMNYQARDEFFDAIKWAKGKVEYSYELSLRTRGSAGDIFGLKNFGWRDKQETDITTNGKDMPGTVLVKFIGENDERPNDTDSSRV